MFISHFEMFIHVSVNTFSKFVTVYDYLVKICYFLQPFCHKNLGIRAHLSKCWMGTWPEKVWDPCYKQSIKRLSFNDITELHDAPSLLLEGKQNSFWKTIS